MERLIDPLPPRARLLHIGLAKTGTTVLQHAAADSREALLEHGVRYPGTSFNHREAVSALMGRRWGWIGPGASVPPIKRWQRLMREVTADQESRIWVSHEFASECDDENAAKFRDELGERLRVVITLRPFAAMLVSSWQQYLKGGSHRTFDTWLHAVLDDPPKTSVTPSFHVRNDQGAVVDRWVRVAGRENVTLVVVDKNHPRRLTEAFEDLLDLPRGLLLTENVGGMQTNRSMSMQEGELLRQVNLGLRGQGVQWKEYERLLRTGGVARMLAARRPAPDEPMLALPEWAAEEANRRSRRYVDQMVAAGTAVVGDLEVLARPVRGVEQEVQEPSCVDIAVAADLVLGTLSAGLGRGPGFAEPTPPPAPAGPKVTAAPAAPKVKPLSQVGARELAGELARRVRRRALRLGH